MPFCSRIPPNIFSAIAGPYAGGGGGWGNPPRVALYTCGTHVSHTHLIENGNPSGENEPPPPPLLVTCTDSPLSLWHAPIIHVLHCLLQGQAMTSFWWKQLVWASLRSRWVTWWMSSSWSYLQLLATNCRYSGWHGMGLGARTAGTVGGMEWGWGLN